jgi:hypothetical protein
MTAINVSRTKLIKALELSLKKAFKDEELFKKKIENAEKKHKADLIQWKKDWDAWQDRYKNLVPNSRVEFIAPNNYAIQSPDRCWEVRIRYVQEFGDIKMNAELNCRVLEKNLPQRPEKPSYWNSCERRIEEITKFLKLLKMSEEDQVSTGVYKNVAEYI